MSTPSVGLFEAKTHLSELVARAEQGEEVIITRHNRPVAKIVPIAEAQQFDRAGRQAAVAKLEALREGLRERHGTLTTAEIVSWVREGRQERDEQIWRNATGGGRALK